MLATPAVAQDGERALAVAACTSVPATPAAFTSALNVYLAIVGALDPAAKDAHLTAFIASLAGLINDANRALIAQVIDTTALSISDPELQVAVAAIADDVAAGVPIDPAVVASLASAN
jgi:hypothetical protein